MKTVETNRLHMCRLVPDDYKADVISKLKDKNYKAAYEEI